MSAAKAVQAREKPRAVRAALLICVLAVVASLAASLVLSPPTRFLIYSPANLLALVAGGLGVIAGTLGWLASRRAAPVTMVADAKADAPHEMQAALTELQALLREERSVLASMREQSDDDRQEALLVGAKLARLTQDAEMRMDAVVAKAATDPTGAAARITSSLLRVERALPELADIIRSGPTEDSAARQMLLAQQAAAFRMQSEAEAAIQKLGAVASSASGQIIAMQATSDALRSEVGALDALASDVRSAIAELPHAARTINAAADQVVQSLHDAQAGLHSDGEGFAAAHRELAHATSSLHDEMESVRLFNTEAARQIIGASDQAADAVKLALAELPTLFGTLKDELAHGVTALSEGVQTLDDVGAQVTASSAGIAEMLTGATAQVNTALEGLPGAAAGITALLQEVQRDTHGLSAVSQQIASTSESLRHDAEALSDMGHSVSAASAQMVETIDASAAEARAVLQELHPAAQAISAASEQAAQMMAASQAEVPPMLQNMAAELAKATAALRYEAQTLDATSAQMAATGVSVAEAVPIAREAMSGLLDEFQREAEALHKAAQLIATSGATVADVMPSATSAITALLAAFQREVLGLNSAAQKMTLTGASIADAVPEATAAMASLFGVLQRETTGLSSAAHQIASVGDALRAEAFSLGAAGQDITTTGAHLVQTIDASADELRGVIQGLPHAVQSLTESAEQTVQTLVSAQAGLRNDGDAVSALHHSLARAASTLQADMQEWQTSNSEAVGQITRASDHAATRVAQAVDALTDRVTESTDVLRQEVQGLDALGAQIAAAGANVVDVVTHRVAAQLDAAAGRAARDLSESAAELQQKAAQFSQSAGDATRVLTSVAERADTSVSTLEASGRAMHEVGDATTDQVAKVSGMLEQLASAQENLAQLPELSDRLAQSVDRLSASAIDMGAGLGVVQSAGQQLSAATDALQTERKEAVAHVYKVAKLISGEMGGAVERFSDIGKRLTKAVDAVELPSHDETLKHSEVLAEAISSLSQRSADISIAAQLISTATAHHDDTLDRLQTALSEVHGAVAAAAELATQPKPEDGEMESVKNKPQSGAKA